MNPEANGTHLQNGSDPPSESALVTESDTPSAAETATASDESFEARVRELEAIVRTLENGQVPLEDSIRLLQRGMTLARSCDATLAQAEAALEELVATEEGELTTQPLDWDED